MNTYLLTGFVLGGIIGAVLGSLVMCWLDNTAHKYDRDIHLTSELIAEAKDID